MLKHGKVATMDGGTTWLPSSELPLEHGEVATCATGSVRAGDHALPLEHGEVATLMRTFKDAEMLDSYRLSMVKLQPVCQPLMPYLIQELPLEHGEVATLRDFNYFRKHSELPLEHGEVATATAPI